MRLLQTLAVVALRVGQAKQPLFEKGATMRVSRFNRPVVVRGGGSGAVLFLVPESKCNILVAMRVADTGNAVLTPSVRAGAGVVVREIYRDANRAAPCQLATVPSTSSLDAR